MSANIPYKQFNVKCKIHTELEPVKCTVESKQAPSMCCHGASPKHSRFIKKPSRGLPPFTNTRCSNFFQNQMYIEYRDTF